MFGSCVVYLGLMAAFLGTVSLAKPLAFLRIRSRREAALALIFGVAVIALGWALPAKESKVDAPRSQLDRFVPVYQFNEVHSVRIQASREQIYRSIKEVT